MCGNLVRDCGMCMACTPLRSSSGQHTCRCTTHTKPSERHVSASYCRQVPVLCIFTAPAAAYAVCAATTPCKLIAILQVRLVVPHHPSLILLEQSSLINILQ
jgi:hypothetical protein